MDLSKRTYIILSALLVAAIAGLFFVYSPFDQKGQSGTANEASEVIGRLGRLALLPVGEEPTVATISNLDSLKEQPFFSRAEVGDKVIIYTKAGKAFIYRPSIDKLVEASPLITDVSQTQ